MPDLPASPRHTISGFRAGENFLTYQVSTPVSAEVEAGHLSQTKTKITMNASQLEQILDCKFNEDGEPHLDQLLKEAEQWPESGRARLLRTLGAAFNDTAFGRMCAVDDEEDDEDAREFEARQTADLLQILKIVQAAYPKSGGSRFSN